MNIHKKIITNISVRFRDIDSMGHVNNAVFFTYFEDRIVNRDDESIVYAKGKSIQIFFDYKNNSTIPIPKYFLDKMLEYADR
jgi:acyl-CoA thioesterase FadM